MPGEMTLAISIFSITYAFLIWDKVDRAIVSLIGACVLLLLGVLTQEHAVEGVDFNTIGLLVGMMVIVAVCMKTGMFQYLAIKSAKLAKGEPIKILIYLSIATALLSALLDNVTTVLLIAPITLLIADELKISPYPFLYAEIFAAAIGGAATLIGHPPNIMIGSAKGLTFMDFIFHTAPAAIIVFAATMVVLKLIYGKELKINDETRERIMQFKEKEAITDFGLLKKCLIVLGLVIIGFIIHGYVSLEPATIALFGAALILLITKENLHDIMGKVEWQTIFFFIGLFVMVRALVEVGFITLVANKVISITGGDLAMTSYAILWLAGIASGFVDNIPFTATVIPLIKDMEPYLGGSASSMPVWWGLSLGAGFGANSTIIGAAANVIVAGISRKSGYPITFMGFFKVGFPLMLMSLVISTIYIYLRYL